MGRKQIDMLGGCRGMHPEKMTADICPVITTSSFTFWVEHGCDSRSSRCPLGPGGNLVMEAKHQRMVDRKSEGVQLPDGCAASMLALDSTPRHFHMRKKEVPTLFMNCHF